ncbi:hypothetical protein CJ030_MR3G001118 [Morella rubra]|uniref:HAT C-terminal dimerisation domain-containing protein n=1 Tax=Morella rubra TaxID=262757 RepID=A0A6A1W2C0_9ROSI|nr:hypothetical protein CJ030_MR3G001118 [Morella rubra]
MARDILAIPMSISTSNYAFSTETMTINPAFDGHDPDIVEALICGEDWLEKPKSNAPNKGNELSTDSLLDRERPAHSSQLFSEPSLSPLLQEKPASPTATNTRLLLVNPSSTLPLESNNHCSPLYVPCSPQYISPCPPTSPITIPTSLPLRPTIIPHSWA